MAKEQLLTIKFFMLRLKKYKIKCNLTNPITIIWNWEGAVSMKEYIIKSGDNFYTLAQQYGCGCQEIVNANPGVDPCKLQVGQCIKVPVVVVSKPAVGCAEFTGQGMGHNRCDDVMVEVEGVKFRVTRAGEPTTPHENHLILPRIEMRKVEHPGTGIIETNIMISNINIVNSPRFEGEERSSTQSQEPETTQNPQIPQNFGSQNSQFGSQNSQFGNQGYQY